MWPQNPNQRCLLWLPGISPSAGCRIGEAQKEQSLKHQDPQGGGTLRKNSSHLPQQKHPEAGKGSGLPTADHSGSPHSSQTSDPMSSSVLWRTKAFLGHSVGPQGPLPLQPVDADGIAGPQSWLWPTGQTPPQPQPWTSSASVLQLPWGLVPSPAAAGTPRRHGESPRAGPCPGCTGHCIPAPAPVGPCR